MIRPDPTRPPEREHADLTLPSGCASCGGDLELRLSPGSSHAYCPQCRWLSQPRLSVKNGVMQVAQPLVAQA